MNSKMLQGETVFGIRSWVDGEKIWFLLEDIRRALRKPKLKGMGERKYIKFDRGPWLTVRLRLVTADALLEYARQYSDNPMEKWRNALQAVCQNEYCPAISY